MMKEAMPRNRMIDANLSSFNSFFRTNGSRRTARMSTYGVFVTKKFVVSGSSAKNYWRTRLRVMSANTIK